jgi:hypothetical protein
LFLPCDWHAGFDDDELLLPGDNNWQHCLLAVGSHDRLNC